MFVQLRLERSLKGTLISPATDTKTRILDVAFRLFHEQGYHATGIATILREAEANAGSLYHYFPSKEALLVGVLEYAAQIMHGVVMAPAEAATADPIERIFALLNNYRRGMEMFHCKMGCPIGNLALEVGDDYPPARALIDLNFRNWASVIAGWLEGASNRFPADVDKRSLAHFVLTVMEGGIMQARAAGNLKPFDESVGQLRSYIELLLERAKRGSA